MSFLLANHTLLRQKYPTPLNLPPPPTPFTLNTVPHYVWRTWKDDSWKQECVSAYNATIRVLPDWDHFVWTDQDCRTFVQATFDPVILQAYDACNYGVMKADLWRYLVLYWYGGLYVDIKTTVQSRPSFQMSQSEVPRVYSSPWDLSQFRTFHQHVFTRGELQQFWIAAEPGSPAIWAVVCQVVANIMSLVGKGQDEHAPFIFLPQQDSVKSRIISTTGPIAFTYALAQCDPKAVIILSCDCNHSINYFPPNRREQTNRRLDHYTKQRKPLVIRKDHV